ncbi:MAG: NAD(+)/NADH kinase [Candidatus Bipolaricaulota bacterium]|nr:NAD(+)/NADH kinase [Candidatus Bipolaricaulota bacterium]
MEIRRLYIVANTEKDGSLRTLAVLKAWCNLKGITPVAISRDESFQRVEPEEALIVALGGDGTVLRAASLFADFSLPILGVNLGSLGFLTQVEAPALTIALEAILKGEFFIEERMRLAFRLADEDRLETALNDIVITPAAGAHFCEIELLWRGERVATYPGDGLIFATATGSSAYSLSTGGPVIVPPMPCIAVTPLAVHKLGVRPVIFSPEEKLLIHATTGANVRVDGDFSLSLAPGIEAEIEQAPLPTRLVRIGSGRSFFGLLEEKLNWGDHSPREKKKG